MKKIIAARLEKMPERKGYWWKGR